MIWIVRAIGLLVAAASVWMLLMSIGVLESAPSPTPAWLQSLVAVCFIMAGLYLALIGYSGQPGTFLISRFIYYWTGSVILVVFTILVNWIAFGPGERGSAGGGIDLPFFYLPLPSGDFTARVMFGFSAVVLDLIWLRGLYWLLIEKRRARDKS